MLTDRCLSAWAATTRDKNYIRMEGLRRLVNDPKHRKEVVAGGLAQFLVKGAFGHAQTTGQFRLVWAEFRSLAGQVGDIAGDLWTAYTDYHDERLFRPLRIILIPLCELPLVRSPKSVSSRPVELGSYRLRYSLLSEQSSSRRRYRSRLRPST